jgi:hypothetical protein
VHERQYIRKKEVEENIIYEYNEDGATERRADTENNMLRNTNVFLEIQKPNSNSSI